VVKLVPQVEVNVPTLFGKQSMYAVFVERQKHAASAFSKINEVAINIVTAYLT